MRKALIVPAVLSLLCIAALASCTGSNTAKVDDTARPLPAAAKGYRWTLKIRVPGEIQDIESIDPNHVWLMIRNRDRDQGFQIALYDGNAVVPHAQLPTLSMENESTPLPRYAGGFTASDGAHVWAWQRTGEILFYDGATWKQVYKARSISNAFALDPTHVWFTTMEPDENILFFDGANFTAQTVPARNGSLCSVWASDPNNVFAGETEGGRIHFFDGSRWYAHARLMDRAGDVFQIVGADARTVWASTSTHGMQFFDGNAWLQQSRGAAGDLAASDSTHAWMTNGLVFFNDGSGWVRQFETEERIHSISCDSGGTPWAAGSDGGVYVGTSLRPRTSDPGR